LNFQRVLALSKNNLKVFTREPAALFLILLFPVALTLAFGAAFGAVGGGQSTTYPIGLVNLDLTEPYPQYSQQFIDALDGTDILKIQIYPDNETAQIDLMQGKIQAVVLIPQNFGASYNSFLGAPEDPSSWENAKVELYLDRGSIFATQAIPPIIQQVIVATLYGDTPTTPSGPIQLGIPSLVEAAKFTSFDYTMPGLFAYAAIFIIMIVAQSFAVNREKGLLRRINTTPTTPAEFMTGNVVPYMLISLIQVALVFATAFLMGYRPMGGAAGLILAFVIVSIFSLCCVGFGLITATITKSPGAATGAAFIFILPLMFLGTFVTAGLSPSAQAVGKFIPSYYVTDALTSLFLRGAPVSSPTIILDLATVSVYSVVVLILGVLLFRKYGKA